MTIGEFKQHVKTSKQCTIKLPNGEIIPEHFHITEVGLITKDYVDCGGIQRREQYISLQLRVA